MVLPMPGPSGMRPPMPPQMPPQMPPGAPMPPGPMNLLGGAPRPAGGPVMPNFPPRPGMPPPGMPPGGIPQGAPMPGGPGPMMPQFPPRPGMGMASLPPGAPGMLIPPGGMQQGPPAGMMGGPPPGAMPPPPTPAQTNPPAPQRSTAELEADFIDKASAGRKNVSLRPGFKVPEKPSVGQIHDWARQDAEYWAPAYREVSDDLSVLYGYKTGNFEIDLEDPDYQPFRDTALIDDFSLANDYIAALPIRPIIDYTNPALRQPTQMCEDFGRWFVNELIHRHAEQGNGSLQHDVTWYGMATALYVAKLLPNFNDENFPWSFHLLDPVTVYPVWQDGLKRVTRHYRATVAQVIGAYETGDGKVRAKMLDYASSSNQTSDPTGYDNGSRGKGMDTLMHHLCDIVEYWDEWYFAVTVMDQVIIPPTPHKLGYVPFVIQVVSKGKPMSARTPVDMDVYNAYSKHYGRGFAEPWMSKSDVWQRDQLREKLTTFIRNGKRTHLQKEAVLGRLYTEIYKSNDPATIHKRSPENDDEGTVRFRTETGYTNTIDVDEDVAPFQPIPPQALLAPVMGQIQKNESTHTLPMSAYGINENSNVTGVAMEGLNETGKDRINVYVIAEQLFYARLIAMALTQVRDHGDKMGPDGQRGAVIVPFSKKQSEDQPPAFELTADVVRQVSRGGVIRVKVTKLSYKLSNLAPILNAGRMGVEGKFFSRRWVQDQIGIEDPDGMLLEMLDEEALNSEAVLKVKTYRAMKKFGDEEDAMIYAMLELAPIMQQLQGGGQPGGMPGGMPGPQGPTSGGMPPPSSGGPNGMPTNGMPQVPQAGGGGLPGGPGPMGGVSMPNMGMAAGQGGGRPMGS